MDNLSLSSLLSEPLTPDESQRLFELCAEGDLAARERIIVAYLPKVMTLCKKYEGKGVPSDDLFQEGSYGLMVALDKYDYRRGTNFATHATPYIEKYLKKAQITQSAFQPIVYKEDFFYEMQKYIRTLDEQTEKLNRTPTNEELAKALRTTENKIRKLSQSLYSFFPVEDLVISPTDEAIPSVFPDSSTEDAVVKQILDLSCLKIELSERETEVISRRFGFTQSGIPEDIATISASMGLSYETIRLAYDNAIQRLRNAVKKHGYTKTTISI